MKFYQITILAVVLVLVILGLNTSNQGVNRLTMENRSAVLAFSLKPNSICLELLGQDYDYPRDSLSWQRFKQRAEELYHQGKKYPAQIRAVFEALLSP